MHLIRLLLAGVTIPQEGVVPVQVGRQRERLLAIRRGEMVWEEIDLVTHDARTFFGLLLRRNGYVLEQLYSPLVVRTTPEHAELKELGRSCITRYHSHHYLGFARTQWGLFATEQPHRIKPLLYVYRVLLSGIHLVQTGEVEANLVTLNEQFQLPGVDDLIARTVTGWEQVTLAEADVSRHERAYERLQRLLLEAHEASGLPETPSARPALDELLVRLHTPHQTGT